MHFNHIQLENPFPDLSRKTINGIRQYSTPEGLVYPSVTTVLSNADKNKEKALKKWKENVGEEKAKNIRNIAASKGTGLHKSIEDYLKNNPNYMNNIMPNAKAMFFAVKPEIDKINNIHYQEKSLYSDRLKLAGTVDCIAEYDGVLSCIDFKNARTARTEKMIWTYFLQTCAYSLMYNEWYNKQLIKQIVIIMAVESDEPQIFIKDPMTFAPQLLKVVKEYHLQNP